MCELPEHLAHWVYGIQRRTHRCLHRTDRGQPTGRHLSIHLTTIPDTQCECGTMCVRLGMRENRREMAVFFVTMDVNVGQCCATSESNTIR